MRYCSSCESEVGKGEYKYWDSEILCLDCLDDILHEENILDSCEKPEPIFLKMEKDDDLFMGFELEVEVDSYIGDKSEKLGNYLTKQGVIDHFYLKEDGSLDNGFELVSHPITLNYARKKLKLKKILKWLRSNGFESQDNCGLHIHIGTDFLSEEDIVKLRAFFSLNKYFLYVFSKREEIDNNYCMYERFNLDRFISGEVPEDRYWALNLNTEQDTVEIRIFSSTLDENRFFAYLGFVDALVRYCKKYTLKTIIQGQNSESSWNYFISWLVDYKRKYKITQEELKKDKLIKVRNRVV